MKTPKLLLLISVSLFAGSASAEIPNITDADFHVLPSGETINITGTGLADTTSASMIWAGPNRFYPATAYPVDDANLGLVMPEFDQLNRSYYLLVETATGSTIGVPAKDLQEYTVDGGFVDEFDHRPMVVRSGATLSGTFAHEIIVVEAGGVLRLNSLGFGFNFGVIVAEDGATVDFTGLSGASEYAFLYSPDTVIVGTIPNDDEGQSIGRQLTTIKTSYGLNTFRLGPDLDVNVTLNGGGAVTFNPVQSFYTLGTELELTAVPDAGQVFSGWSGDLTSSDNPLAVTMGNADLSLTATFSSGWLLDVHNTPGVSVVASPVNPAYPNGQVVTLSATPDPGYSFVGWIGDSTDTTAVTSLTMDGNKVVIPIVNRDDYGDLPQVTGADFHAAPVGETLTLSGANLSGVTGAHFITPGFDDIPAVTSVVDGSSVELVMPAGVRSSRNHYLILESAVGSTIGIPSENFIEHTIQGPLVDDTSRDPVVVRSGGVLRGALRAEIVVVEAGGVFEFPGSVFPGLVIAEDGALVDFSAVGGHSDASFYYSPGTVIIGDIPGDLFLGNSIGTQLPSIKTSFGVEPFTLGYKIDLTISGEGSVVADPDQPYYENGDTVTLTAVPGANSTFLGWVGGMTSTTNPLELTFGFHSHSLTAIFPEGWILDLVEIPGVSVVATPEKAAYLDGESVSLTATLEDGYVFESWLGDTTDTTLTTSITMDANKRTIPLVRKSEYSELPQLEGSDRYFLPAGETFTLSGTGLADTTEVSVLGGGWASDFVASSNVVSDVLLEVEMPGGLNRFREHILLVETASGTTLGVPFANVLEHTVDGDLVGDPSGRVIVVRPGGVLSEVVGGLIIIEAGGVFEVPARGLSGAVFAEDGAIVDFTRVPRHSEGRLYHSPDTVILGDIPEDLFFGISVANPITSFSASYGIDAFEVGITLNVIVEGPGSVSVSPEQDFYRHDDVIELTAIPDDGAFFIRWVGSRSGDGNVISGKAARYTARFSNAPDYFTTWRVEHFTVEELADLSISAFDADPDGDSLSNAAEYAFGTDPRVSNNENRIQIEPRQVEGENKVFATYVRPKNALDVGYRILLSRNMSVWNHNDDESGLVYSEEAGVESIDEDFEKVSIELFPGSVPPGTFFVRVSALLFE